MQTSSGSEMTRAVVVVAKGEAAVQEVNVPVLRDDWVLVQVKAVALNPSDWKHIDFGGADPGSRVGCDYAGIVSAVGGNVSRFNVGDRICGAVHGSNRMNHECGAFGQIITAKAALQMRIPDHMSFEEAATVGVATITIGLGLYKSLGLPLPNTATTPGTLLIHGASTVVGMYSIQWAKASGFQVLATCSSRNFDLVKSLGADAVFDYKSPTCADDIQKHCEGLNMVWDCVGGQGIASALCKSGGKYVMINPVEHPFAQGVSAEFVLGYDAWGEEYVFRGEKKPVRQDCFDFTVAFLLEAEKLFGAATIRSVNYTLNSTGGGLDGALKGLDVLRAGVSATKLVYAL